MTDTAELSTVATIDPLLLELRRIVGDAHAVSGVEAPDALVDHRSRYVGRARAVVRPGSVDEVAAVVRLLAREEVPIVPQGGHTSLVGGATPDDSGRAVVISLKRLDKVRAIDLDNDTITVEAGVVLRRLQDTARDAGRLFPLSLGSEDSCTIGGNLGSNAGGVQVLRYGNARDLTLGLEVVTPSGEVWHGLRGLRKDNSGYDLRDLYIGSEGTLGIITAATLKLYPLPVAQRTAFIKLDSTENLLALFGRARAGFGASLTAFEAISGPAYALVEQRMPEERIPFPAEPNAPRWYVLLEISDNESEDHAARRLEDILGAALGDGVALDALMAQSLAHSQEFWRLRQYAIAQAQARDGGVVLHDISLPISALPDFLRHNEANLQSMFPGVRVFAYGHIGDGNLHYHIGRPIDAPETYLATNGADITQIVQDDVVSFGGSIAAEHGVGRSKRDALLRHKSPIELRLMHAIKHALDPQGIMNPGQLLPRRLHPGDV